MQKLVAFSYKQRERAVAWQAGLSVVRGEVRLEGGGGGRQHAVSAGVQHGQELAMLGHPWGNELKRWASPEWRRPWSPLASTQKLGGMYIARVF